MQMFCFILVLLVCACVSVCADWSLNDGTISEKSLDNTARIQQVLDEAGKAGGGVVNIPAGRFAVKGNLSVPSGVTLQGTYRATPVMGPWDYKTVTGTVLLAYAGRGSRDGKSFIKLGSASAVAGMIIIYPEWNKADVPPVPYPPCISAEDTNNAAIMDINIMNAYEAINLVRAHRHLVRNFQGYPIWRGIYVDQCYDIGRIENVHIWPFGVEYKPDDPYCKWINLNGVAFEFARTDWEYVTNTFCFGYGVGYKFSETKAGSANGNFLGIGADCCERAVLVEQCQPPGLLITNGEFVGRWSSQDAITLEVGEKTTGKVSLTNCSFWGPIDTLVWMRSPKGQFTADACNFVQWDCKLIGSPGIRVDAGRVIVQGSTFDQERQLHFKIGKDAKSVIIMGNQADGGLNVDNEAGDRVQLIGNEAGGPEPTAEQLANYTVSIGSDDDNRVVRNWHGPEAAAEWGGEGTKRWSTPGSRLLLPVLKNRNYDVEFDVLVPESAIESAAGIYLGDKRIVGFEKPGTQVLKGVIPASKSDRVVLDIKCKGWKPSSVIKGSTDGRTLGIAMRSVVMKAKASQGTPSATKDKWQGF